MFKDENIKNKTNSIKYTYNLTMKYGVWLPTICI